MKWLCDFELARGQLLLIHLTGGGWTANCHNARIAYIYIYLLWWTFIRRNFTVTPSRIQRGKGCTMYSQACYQLLSCLCIDLASGQNDSRFDQEMMTLRSLIWPHMRQRSNLPYATNRTGNQRRKETNDPIDPAQRLGQIVRILVRIFHSTTSELC